MKLLSFHRCHALIALSAIVWLNVAPLLGTAVQQTMGWHLLGVSTSTTTPASDVMTTSMHASENAPPMHALDPEPSEHGMHHGSARCPLCVLGNAVALPVNTSIVLAVLPRIVAVLAPVDRRPAHVVETGAPLPPRAPPHLS